MIPPLLKESILNFCDQIGIAKANSMVDVSQLEFCIRDDRNSKKHSKNYRDNVLTEKRIEFIVQKKNMQKEEQLKLEKEKLEANTPKEEPKKNVKGKRRNKKGSFDSVEEITEAPVVESKENRKK